MARAATAPLPVMVPPLSLINTTREPGRDLAPRRAKIWQLSRHLHCSIIGTCLSTVELRHILVRCGRPVEGATDHELHGLGVLVASQHDISGKLLHKALDRRHRQAINQFERAKAEAEVLALWREAVKRGEIPGAYWAALTHAAANDALVRIIFGEVHMLSHLVGAANRADIRRLSALEAENAQMQEKLRRQQAQLHEGLSSRDARIRDLESLLAHHIADSAPSPRESAKDAEALAIVTRLVGELKHRLTSECNRRRVLEARVTALTARLAREEGERRALAAGESLLRRELEVLEASLRRSDDGNAAAFGTRLDGLALLYVGGRANQMAHLRRLATELGLEFLAHDGGIDERGGLLAGLVSRAHVVMFPVDCVSHEAAAMVKRLCRQAAKPFIPLRSSGLSSFVAALQTIDPAPAEARR